MENPVEKYSANTDGYYEYTHLFSALAQTLGEGYAIHKQDIFVRKQFEPDSNELQGVSFRILFQIFQRQKLHGQHMLSDHHTGIKEKQAFLPMTTRNGGIS